MLVEDLIKHTPANHPDFSHLTHALEVIVRILSKIDY